jgi:hypothetical protein
MLHPYHHVLQERRCQDKQTNLLSYFEKKPEEPNPNMLEDPFDPDDPQPGHSSRQ